MTDSNLIGIIFILSAILIAVFWRLNHTKLKYKLDFLTMVIVGVSWFILGFLMSYSFIIFIGAFFGIWGLIKKSKWKDNFHSWEKQKAEDVILWGGIIILFLVLVSILVSKLSYLIK